MRTTRFGCVGALLFLLFSSTGSNAFQLRRPTTRVCATSTAAAGDVCEVFADVRDLIASELSLTTNCETSPLTVDGGGGGTVATWDGDMEANVAWLSSLELTTDEGAGFASFQAFVGPKSDVPHFVARAQTTPSASSIRLYLDFLPRLDAAYDAPRLDDGSYAAPTSREGFAAAGVRKQYADEYFTEDAEAWASGAAAIVAGAERSQCPEPKEYVEISHHGACSGLINGPLLLELDLPDTAAGREACSTLAAQAARRWLGWTMAKNAQGNMDMVNQAGWLTSRMIYARDCQVRNQIYAAAAARVSKFLASGGGGLTAAAVEIAQLEAGPLDMVGHNSLGPDSPSNNS